MSELIKTYEKAKTRVRHSALRMGVLYATSMSGLLLRSNPGSRDHLPEPFDLPDHIGNIDISSLLGYTSGLAAGQIYSSFEQKCEPKEAIRKTRTVMALAGFCVGLVANAATETKLGLSFVPGTSGTPDGIDLLYGVAASTIAATAGPLVSGIDTSSYISRQYLEDNGRLQPLDSVSDNVDVRHLEGIVK